MRIYFVVKTMSKLVNLSAKDVETFTAEVLLFVGEYIEEMSNKVLFKFITEKDIIDRNFFDYFFGCNAIELKNQMYIYQVIDTMWDHRKLAKQSEINLLIMHEMEYKNIRFIEDLCKL